MLVSMQVKAVCENSAVGYFTAGQAMSGSPVGVRAKLSVGSDVTSNCSGAAVRAEFSTTNRPLPAASSGTTPKFSQPCALRVQTWYSCPAAAGGKFEKVNTASG